VLYGWIRQLIQTDHDEVIWAIVAVVVVAFVSHSPTATVVAAGLVVVALLAYWWLNRKVRRPRVAPDAGGAVRPMFVAAAFCAVLAVGFSKLGLFDFAYGVGIFALIAYVAFSVSRPRRS
jgi:cytochrome bd-type quinol oxidase subunit 1